MKSSGFELKTSSFELKSSSFELKVRVKNLEFRFKFSEFSRKATVDLSVPGHYYFSPNLSIRVLWVSYSSVVEILYDIDIK